MYPKVPNVAPKANRFGAEMKPAVLNSRCNPPVLDNKLSWRPVVVEMSVGVDKKSDVK